jgi:hypothetical protein
MERRHERRGSAANHKNVNTGTKWSHGEFPPIDSLDI